jgi:hypothetical protein
VSAAGGSRVVRSYTSARRHAYKVGKFGDWTVPFGPYSPAQLIVMVAGAVLLIRTFSLWKVAGPLPVIAWIAAIWAVRGTTIGGRSPLAAAWGWLCLLLQPKPGRIGGRAARRPRPVTLYPAFTIAELPAPAGTHGAAEPVEEQPARLAVPVTLPGSALSRLLAAAAHVAEREEGA